MLDRANLQDRPARLSGCGSGVASLEEALSGLRAGAKIDVPFRVTHGTYADILHWLATGAVDMAVVSPVILARAMDQGGDVRWEYLATVSSPSAPSPSLSVALVRDDSPARTVDDLRSVADAGRVRSPFRRSALGVRRGGAADRSGRREDPGRQRPDSLLALSHELASRPSLECRQGHGRVRLERSARGSNEGWLANH